MNTDPYLMISGDCHAGPPQPGFTEYFDPQYRKDFEDYWTSRPTADVARLAHARKMDKLADLMAGFMVATGADEAQAQSFASNADRFMLGLFDSDIRKDMLDEEGIVAEVIFPDGFCENHVPFSTWKNPVGTMAGRGRWPFELRMAGARAYHRWLAEFCAKQPGQRLGVIYLPTALEMDRIVAEVQWCYDNGLRGGIMLPRIEDGVPGYHDSYYDPLWSIAESLDLPITAHGGSSGSAPDAATTFGPEEPIASVLYFTEVQYADRRALWMMCFGGVFDRFPNLKLVYAEALSFWVPDVLRNLDEVYEMWNARRLREQVEHKPSEYWRRNCAITASFISRHEAEIRHEISLPNMMWASDYPHPEGTWPYTETCLQHSFHGLPEPEVRQILGLNALDFYSALDREQLAPLAHKLGRSPETVYQKNSTRPDDYLGMGMR